MQHSGNRSSLNSKRDGRFQTSRSLGAQIDAHVMLQGWTRLSAAASQCQSTFQAQVTAQVALQAAISLQSQFSSTVAQYGNCACQAASGDSVAVQYQTEITRLMTSFQAILQVGQQRYGQVWASQFKPVFARCSSGFKAMASISAELNIDLTATVQNANLDLGLFADCGLNLSFLLGIRIQIGGLIGL